MTSCKKFRLPLISFIHRQLFSSFSSETRYIQSALQRQAINGTLFFCTAKITMFATLITYVLEGHLMNAADIFITFGLFGSMRLSVTIAVPFGVQHASESLVALKRIQVFQS